MVQTSYPVLLYPMFETNGRTDGRTEIRCGYLKILVNVFSQTVFFRLAYDSTHTEVSRHTHIYGVFVSLMA